MRQKWIYTVRVESPRAWMWTGGFLCAFLALMAFLLWKCRYGLASPDEAFYLVTPLRFVRGDLMLVDEWHLTQFASFTMIPEVGLYLLLSGSTEGMLLSFRILYVLMWSAGCLFLYFRIRQYHLAGAMCSSLFLLCYAPFGIMAFSYNSLGILYLMNASAFLVSAGKNQKLSHLLSGLFFAGAVLCCPYLALVYAGYSLALGIRLIRKRNDLPESRRTELKAGWKWFTLGAGILAALLGATLLAGASLSELGVSLRQALQDEEHAHFSLMEKAESYFSALATSNRLFIPLLAVLGGAILGNRIRRHPAWFWIVCGASVLYLREFMRTEPYLNFLMLPLTFPGIYVMCASRNARIRKLGCFWLIPGILYTFCLHYSSNTGIYAISSAASVSSSAALVMMGMYVQETEEERAEKPHGKMRAALTCAAALICFAFQMRYEIPMRYQSVFQEPGLMKYEEQRQLEAGPQKGILVTAEDSNQYEWLYLDAEQIQNQKVLFLTVEIWPYLMNQNELASFSGWLGSINSGWNGLVSSESMTRLAAYYRLRPEKIPDVIVVREENVSAPYQYFDFPLDPPERAEHGYVLIRRADSGEERP